MAYDWIDVSIPLGNGMPHWPDNPLLQINRTMNIACGGGHGFGHFHRISHRTHMDASLDFLKAGRAIHELSMWRLPKSPFGIHLLLGPCFPRLASSCTLPSNQPLTLNPSRPMPCDGV